MSLIVASGVDFLVGITAVVVEVVLGVTLGLVLGAVGEEDLVGEGDASDFGGGVAVASVGTETLGSRFSEAVASGEEEGDALSSWARANGVARAKSAVMATIVIFIWFSG